MERGKSWRLYQRLTYRYLQQFQTFGGFLTVGGGRGIRFNLFVQSFSQLNEKYGDNTAQNILDNCYVWNYLKTSNEVTAEKISKKIRNIYNFKLE